MRNAVNKDNSQKHKFVHTTAITEHLASAIVSAIDGYGRMGGTMQDNSRSSYYLSNQTNAEQSDMLRSAMRMTQTNWCP